MAPKNASQKRKNQPRIVVVGSAVVDLTTFADRFPGPGETLFGDRFDLGFGGKGANQAVAARLCSADVEMVAHVGDDLFGPATLSNFRSHGVGTRHVKVIPKASSGAAPILVEGNGQNRILVVKGANDTVAPKDVDAASPILEKADLILLQFEIPMRTIYHTIKLARKYGVRCILNPAPACNVDLRKIRHADYFVPNETEAAEISGLPVRNLTQAKKCARHLVELGFRRVILTLGSRGVVLAGSSSGSESVEVFHTPAFEVSSVDTSGAGDAFIGSFAAFLGEGIPEREAISRACLFAAISTMQIGTQKSFIDRQRFEREWRKRG